MFTINDVVKSVLDGKFYLVTQDKLAEFNLLPTPYVFMVNADRVLANTK